MPRWAESPEDALKSSFQDIVQHRPVDLGRLQTLQEPLERCSASFAASPPDQTRQDRAVSAERVIGPAPEHRLRRQTQIQQDLLPLRSETGRQPGKLPVRWNPLENRVWDLPGVC